jgi:hypothetical protein
MDQKKRDFFLENVFSLLKGKKNFENIIIISNLYNNFYEILRKLLRKSQQESDFKLNFMEFAANEYKDFKEVCKKIRFFMKNFCISKKSLFPFAFIFFHNFDLVSKEYQSSIKNIVDASGNYIRFFFFCEKKENIDFCIFSRSVPFFFFPIDLKFSPEKTFATYSLKKPKKIFEQEKNSDKFLSLKIYKMKNLIRFMFKFLRRNCSLKISLFDNDIFFFFYNILKKSFNRIALNFFFRCFTRMSSRSFSKKFSEFLISRKKSNKKRHFFFLS